MVIGQFYNSNGGYVGELHTLTMNHGNVRIVPVVDEPANRPHFRIWSSVELGQPVEIGAAWRKTGADGEFLSVVLDGPELSEPIHALLVSGEDREMELIWRRDRKVKDKG
jgi:uncharacterized protein (DUF736 family)